jgi:acyl carrier protein
MMDTQLQEAIEDRRQVLDKLKNSLIDRLNLYQTKEQIDDDTPLFGSGLKLDSVDATELVVMLDEEFAVRVTEGDDPSYMRNVNSLASFILKRQAAA